MQFRLGSFGRATGSPSRTAAPAGAALFLVIVAALLLWPPAAGGATVTCGQSITQDTTVDNDLSCPFEGLIIDADNVRVDLGGHRIAGAPAIRDNREGATIENGVVEATGLVGPPGIQLDGAHGTTLNRLWILGFRIERGPFSLGIEATASHGLTIRASVVFGHGLGIALREGGDSRLIDSWLEDNGTGIFLDGDDRGTLIDNTFTGNSVGARVLSSGNRIRGNRAREGDIGIHVACGHGNVVRANRTRLNRTDGIQVDACATGTLLRDNVARRNADDGIHVDAPGSVLVGNGAFRNGDLGIEAVPGVTDAGGNRAAGNGNPAQCENVACSP
jgi:parallel beta-helix repeat protein